MAAKNMTRRKALKTILAAGGGMGAAAFMPARWVKPLVEKGVLPAHAQTSGVKPEAGTQTFNFTGEVQTFEVPAGVKHITVDAWGAGGGQDDITYIGGKGARVKGAILKVTPGETLYIYVGGRGHMVEESSYTGPGGFNGGGLGNVAGGGGGASDVRQGGSGLDKRVAAAGGGGGATVFANGGDGGESGSPGEETSPGFAGGGGTQTAGGKGGTIGFSPTGQDGGLGFGGNGSSNQEGGGGGGGYYGGGGGSFRIFDTAGGGGGGGSSLVPAGATVTSGVDQNEDGKVILSW